MATHALTNCTHKEKKKKVLIVRQTCLHWVSIVLREACDKYLSTLASVFVSLHSGLAYLELFERQQIEFKCKAGV